MILYCARSNILTCHKFFEIEPVRRVELNNLAKTIDVRFDPRPPDQPFELYNFERLFPALEVPKTTVTKFEIVETADGFTITALEKDVKVQTIAC